MGEFSAGSIAVEFKAQTAEFLKGVEEVNKKLDHFKEGVEAIGAFEAFAKLTESLIGCVEKSSEAELNVRKLQAAISSQKDVAKFEELAEGLSHVSTYSKDASISALALLGKFNLTDQQMATMLPHVQDLAAGMGVDLPQAASLAGKAIANGAGGLRGMGLAFTQAEKQAFDYATQSERVAILTDKMSAKFDGLASAAAGTGAGAMKQFHNSTEELQVTLGKLVDSPVADFFSGMATVVDGVTGAIAGMSEGTRTAIAVVGGMVAGLASYALGALAVSKALAFFGGLPAILSTVGAAFTGLASTIATVVLPITVIASTILMIEGMVSRIKAGNFNSAEGIIDGIKNNFKQGLADLRSGMSDLFASPKKEAGDMTEAMKGFDGALTDASQKIKKSLGLDFTKELTAKTDKDPFAELGEGIGLDFAKHKDTSGKDLEGNDLLNAQSQDAINAAALTKTMDNAGATSRTAVGDPNQGMDKGEVASWNDEMKTHVSGVDVAMAGFMGTVKGLAGKFGATGTAIAGVASKLASGDPMGAAVSLGIEMLSRTKSFGKVTAGLDSIFTALSQVLEPLMAAIVPFLTAIGKLVPVVVAMEPGLKLFGAAVKLIGDGLNKVIDAFSGFWNNMLENLASFVSGIPLIGKDLASSIRDAEFKPAEATSNLATAATGAAAAINGVTNATVNVPQGFKLEAARYGAIDSNSAGAIAAALPTMAGTLAAGHPGLGVTSKTGAAATELSTPAAPAPPQSVAATILAGLKGEAAATTPAVQIQNVTVMSNSLDDVLARVKQVAAQATFLSTGKKSAATSMRYIM